MAKNKKCKTFQVHLKFNVCVDGTDKELKNNDLLFKKVCQYFYEDAQDCGGIDPSSVERIVEMKYVPGKSVRDSQGNKIPTQRLVKA